jgi:glycosyltransferase involved in cell wall biosynthesis
MSRIPTVSVLVTVYNREAYLADCLQSILASTWQDFEVVVVDDGSTDGSVGVAERYAGMDPRIRFARNEHNLGDYRNRNRAAALARGKFLKYVDADDVIYSHTLAIMVEAMQRYSDAALGLSWNVVDPPKPFPFVSTPGEVYRTYFLGRSLLGVGPSAAILRRDSFESIGGFSGRQFIGDTELWLRLAARWPVVSLPPSLVWWRQHENQQMALEQQCPEVLNARFVMNESLLENGGVLNAKEEVHAARSRLRQHHARRLLALALRQRQLVVAYCLFRASGLGWFDLVKGCRSYR